jgi:peptidoglycan/LPS O-acetylase OafA/YrhL
MKRLPPASPSLSAPSDGVPKNSDFAAASDSRSLSPGETRPTLRLTGLDGLRALAVIAVLVYHFFPTVLPGGYLGVDVFFVISGFLITSLLLGEHKRSGRISLGRFWKRRVRRLIPPLVPVLLVSATAAWLIGGDVLVGLGRQIFGSLTFSYNWVSIGANESYFSADQPELFRNLWSLAVEEQFYLVWPLALAALLLIRRPRVRIALIVLLAALSALWMGVLYQPGTDPTRVYFGSDTHSFGLAIGAALALILWRRPNPVAAFGLESVTGPAAAATATRGAAVIADTELPRLRPWIGLAALVSLATLSCVMPADNAVAYRGGLFAVSLLTAVAIWAGVRTGRFGQLLDVAPLRALGARSYGLYLWHWPVLILLQLAWPAAAGQTDTGEAAAQPARTVAIGALAMLLSLLAAAASYRWIEQPIRRHGFGGSIGRLKAHLGGTRVQRQTVVVALTATMLLAVGTAAALYSAPTVASAEAVIERGQKAMDAAAPVDPAAAESTSASGPRIVIPLLPEPVDGSVPPPGMRMSAIGDSVMLASAPELQEAFPGIAIDAAVSRGMRAAPEILKTLEDAGLLRDVVVIGLGTNGPIEESDLQQIKGMIGPNRQLILVNAFADRDWTAGVNATLADFSAHYRRIELADWSTAIAPHTDVLAEDNIHPGPTGGRIYAETVGAAAERLASLPQGQQPGPNRLLLLPN